MAAGDIVLTCHVLVLICPFRASGGFGTTAAHHTATRTGNVERQDTGSHGLYEGALLHLFVCRPPTLSSRLVPLVQ